jgi:hypothetical protein
MTWDITEPILAVPNKAPATEEWGTAVHAAAAATAEVKALTEELLAAMAAAILPEAVVTEAGMEAARVVVEVPVAVVAADNPQWVNMYSTFPVIGPC